MRPVWDEVDETVCGKRKNNNNNKELQPPVFEHWFCTFEGGGPSLPSLTGRH